MSLINIIQEFSNLEAIWKRENMRELIVTRSS